MFHILFVEDNALLRQSLAFILKDAGYRVSTGATAEEALALCRHDPPDLVLLDIGLPGMDGLDALSLLRRETDIPVILLTGRRRKLDEALGLQLGADDYVTKPFDESVLLARIKAVLRRGQQTTPPVGAGASTLAAPEGPIQVDDLIIDSDAHTVTLAGEPVQLSPREFALLHVLALHAGRVISLDDILEQAWGPEYVGQPQVVYVHIRWLRQKLEKDPDHPQRILTVRGVGYKLQA